MSSMLCECSISLSVFTQVVSPKNALIRVFDINLHIQGELRALGYS